MDHSAVLFESDLNNGENNENATRSNDHGWQKVTYSKRHRKQKPNTNANDVLQNGGVSGKDNVFQSLEQQAEDRRRRIAEAKRAAAAAEEEFGGAAEKKGKKKWGDEETSDESDEEKNKENDDGVKKVKKAKKPKRPKITVAEAATKIDGTFLGAFLAEISTSYEGQQDIQLMRFADYFGRAFSGVSGAQFPWMKLLREATVAKMADIPLSHISDDVYKTSVDWINQRSLESLGSFIRWCSDSIFADMAGQQTASKGTRKVVQQTSSKSQVAIFVVLAMVLRRKPDALLTVLPTLRENPKYQGQDKLPVHIWMITQACQGDLAVGLYAWAHNLLPLVHGKSFNPQSRDLVLQLVDRISSAPKARTILKSNAVRKGERLIPPAAFETVMRVSFPAPSARVKATERFEALYPLLKEVALGGDPKSKAMKQVLQQIMNFAIKAAGEGKSVLAKEATAVFVWCLIQNADCYKHWDKLYQDNLEASVAILKKLTEEWKQLSANQSGLVALRETMKNFRVKNDKILTSGEDAQLSLYKDADKYCKVLLGRLSRGNGCIKGLAVAVVAIGVGVVVMSPDMESWDWKKLSAVINSHLSF